MKCLAMINLMVKIMLAPLKNAQPGFNCMFSKNIDSLLVAQETPDLGYGHEYRYLLQTRYSKVILNNIWNMFSMVCSVTN